MKTTLATKARLALERLHICVESPSWTVELLCALVAVLIVACLVTLGLLAESMTEARETRETLRAVQKAAALEPTAPMVRLEPRTGRYDCVHFNVRREWEAAVAAECAVMGRLLYLARASQ